MNTPPPEKNPLEPGFIIAFLARRRKGGKSPLFRGGLAALRRFALFGHFFVRSGAS